MVCATLQTLDPTIHVESISKSLTTKYTPSQPHFFTTAAGIFNITIRPEIVQELFKEHEDISVVLISISFNTLWGVLNQQVCSVESLSRK